MFVDFQVMIIELLNFQDLKIQFKCMDTDLVLIGKLFNNVPRDIFNNKLTIESTPFKVFIVLYSTLTI